MTASSHYPDTNLVQTWWHPDGSLTTASPYVPNGEGSYGQDETNVIYREIILQAQRLPAGASGMSIDAFDPATGAASGNVWLHGRQVESTLIGHLLLPGDGERLCSRRGAMKQKRTWKPGNTWQNLMLTEMFHAVLEAHEMKIKRTPGPAFAQPQSAGSPTGTAGWATCATSGRLTSAAR